MMQPYPMSTNALGSLLGVEFGEKPIALDGGEPACLLGPVRQEKQRGKSGDHRHYALHDENPSPARQSKPIYPQKPTGNRRTNGAGNRDRGHEQSDGLGP